MDRALVDDPDAEQGLVTLPMAAVQELMELAEAAIASDNLEAYADRLLDGVTAITESTSVFLYVELARHAAQYFEARDVPPDASAVIEASCSQALRAGPADTGIWQAMNDQLPEPAVVLTLGETGSLVGFLGMTRSTKASDTERSLLDRICHVAANAIERIVDEGDAAGRMAHLNAYQTVASMLAEPLGLHDLIEAALYSCMDVTSAEAASVLLLDDAKENFRFYAVEGPAAPVLAGTTFPAGEGIAGWCLENQKSAVVDDAASNPRFYHGIDDRTSFHTGNMIVVPLTAAEEPVGVLEVLNKSGSRRFTDDERALLTLIAQQIALAVRNAKVFEYVADTYCRQRQGEHSCRGCKRPLGAWTPCVRYREAELYRSIAARRPSTRTSEVRNARHRGPIRRNTVDWKRHTTGLQGGQRTQSTASDSRS